MPTDAHGTHRVQITFVKLFLGIKNARFMTSVMFTRGFLFVLFFNVKFWPGDGSKSPIGMKLNELRKVCGSRFTFMSNHT